SYLDQHYGSTGQINDRFFRGSGTSQAAALVSGAVALVLQQHPELTPNQLKAMLNGNATRLPNPIKATAQGNGEINLANVKSALVPADGPQLFSKSSGLGSLQLSRGSSALVQNGVTLAGEQDIFGHAFDAAAMAAVEEAGNSWSGGDWNGNSWSGNSWSGNSWSGNSWSGNSWSGNSWSGNSWSGNSWSGISWSGMTWSNDSWV
ncbi:MAG: serine protease AprX, partial [Acidimicrobiaceae bacterium]|nr:serine protease AprX [Acidimicrobiaceae bacterium]